MLIIRDADRQSSGEDSNLDDRVDDLDGGERVPRGGPREIQGVPWGPFTVARVKTVHKQTGEKIHIGWGGSCYRHNNVDDENGAICKKHLSGTCGTTHRMICHWLVLGHRCCGPGARENHLAYPVRSLPVPSWDELVQMRLEQFGA